MKYIGALSRFSKINVEIIYDLLVLLSGPEPQRSLLEEKILLELMAYKGKVILIKGLVEPAQTKEQQKNITIYNYMTSNELEKAIQNSNIIISRSGYTSVMDLVKLEKKVLFIPTPGQKEQQYLAKHLSNLKIAPYCNQKDFKLEHLKKLDNYTGLNSFEKDPDFRSLFGLFKGK